MNHQTILPPFDCRPELAALTGERMRLGIKASAIARSLGISGGYLSRMEHGKTRVSPDILQRYRAALWLLQSKEPVQSAA